MVDAMDVIDNTHAKVIDTANNCDGLTKREWFAGIAVSGLCANPEYWGIPRKKAAEIAIELADTLLWELER